MNKCSVFRRINPHLGIEELSVENAVSKAFHKILQHELDPIWHQVPPFCSFTLQVLPRACCISAVHDFAACRISAVSNSPCVSSQLFSTCHNSAVFNVLGVSLQLFNWQRIEFWPFLNCPAYRYLISEF
jgi:hypothetical protein